MRSLIIIAVITSLAAGVRADAPATQPSRLPAGIVLHNLKDQPVTPLDLPAGHRAVVLIFITTDCPICNTYAPTIGDLCRALASRGIDFYTVYEDLQVTAAAASAHHDAYAFPCDGLVDPEQKFAHLAGASVTPEAFVVGPDRMLLYHGRIDDLFTSIGRKRFAATTHELKGVLAEIAADEPVSISPVPAVGCPIP
jgi:thiol-disulfide isomerase/thioredoxin